MSELPTNPLDERRSKAGSQPVAPQSRGAEPQPQQEAGRAGAQQEPGGQPAAGQGGEPPGGQAAASSSPKVFPPDSPVDVPRQPAPARPPDPGQSAQGNLPPHDQQSDSSWADNTEPAPHKTNVRSSIIP